MTDAVVGVLALIGGVLVIAKSEEITQKIIGSQERVGRGIGGAYERLAAPPAGSRLHSTYARGVRGGIVLIGLACAGLGIFGFVASI